MGPYNPPFPRRFNRPGEFMRPLTVLEPELPHWEKTADLVDQCIDLALNLSQSGHPGGSRSKVHALLTLMLSGAMRWDIRHPEARFGDRFVLIAGHCNPVVYASLAVLNEALRLRHTRTNDPRFAHPLGRKFTLLPEDLLQVRRNGGLPGHAEMEGRTLFFKACTGPSGHGAPVAAGQAIALKHAGAGEVRVFAMEGEGGHTAGAHHETKNTAWGLGLGNLIYLLDWNDCGIDEHRISSVVHGTPETWFKSYGWRTVGTEQGSDFRSLWAAFHELLATRDAGAAVPGCVWFKTRKGRGYLKYDEKSHGSPHAFNSELFWKLRDEFGAKYGVTWEGRQSEAPVDRASREAQTLNHLETVFDVLARDEALVEFLSDRLVELGESVPQTLPSFTWKLEADPLADPRVIDPAKLPAEIWFKPGEKQPNRAGFARVGAYLNAIGKQHYGRPLFLVCAADLADSTNISGFGKDWGTSKGFGWYNRETALGGAILPQEITEFTNSGLVCGIAMVNLSEKPLETWRGYNGGCSTYGSFSYLKYGPMRLFSQAAQDSQIKLGRVLWVAGHSGPETAEDSRTHFGIFSPGVTSLFPKGQVLNMHPWEANEVPVVLTAGLATGVPILVLHLTRPPIEIPDRAKWNMDSHMEAARGAYVLRPFDAGRPPEGVVVVRGTSCTANLVKLLPWLADGGPNVKIVAAISSALFRRQPAKWQQRVLPVHEWADSMVVSNTARWNMHNWIPHAVAAEYALTPDWDDRWRTGGSVEQIVAESHLDPESLKAGITRFVEERPERQTRMRALLAGAGASEARAVQA
jgi:transketolase